MTHLEYANHFSGHWKICIKAFAVYNPITRHCRIGRITLKGK